MRWVQVILLGAAVTAGLMRPAHAQASATPGHYVVTYFEVAPGAARKTAALLRQFAAATRKEDGNAELTALHQIGRSGHFVIVEAWRDKAAYEAHAGAMKALGEKLQPVFSSPFSARQFGPLSIAPPVAGADLSDAVFVVTHVDVFPNGKDEANALVRQLAEDSRKDGGALRFDAVIMEGRPNHFHLIEAWSDRRARQAHALVEHTKQFRAKLVPLEGALFDERLFEAVR